MSLIPILVQKFGGTSVSTAERRSQLVGHVARARADGDQVVLVVSAMGRRGDPYATDTLLDLLRSDGGEVNPRDYDLMFTCGEAISAAVVSQALSRAGIPAIALTSAQARIFTDGRHVESEIVEVDTSRLHSILAAGQVPVVTGGQGVARGSLDYTTLGRGGSDTSAVALGVALHARRVDIFTDVEGVATTDPRLCPGARVLGRISYPAMYELARFGAKVVHPRALLTGWKGKVTLGVRSTFSTTAGTLVDDVPDEEPLVGLAVLPPMETMAFPAGSVDESRLEEWQDRRLVMHLTDDRTGMVLLAAASDKIADLREAVRESGLAPSQSDTSCCWLTVVGDPGAVREHAPRLLARLGQLAIAVRAYEVTGRRCTIVVPEAARERAARSLYADAFEAAAAS